jgi:hypothetical protein
MIRINHHHLFNSVITTSPHSYKKMCAKRETERKISAREEAKKRTVSLFAACHTIEVLQHKVEYTTMLRINHRRLFNSALITTHSHTYGDVHETEEEKPIKNVCRNNPFHDFGAQDCGSRCKPDVCPIYFCYY